MSAKTIRLGGTAYRADQLTLTVPENRSRPESRSITVPVTRITSPNTKPSEPIFWLGGGPGLSNLSYEPPDWLLADHDVVLVGYRGVDGSAVLDCPEITRAMRGTGSDLLSTDSLARLAQAAGRAARRLQGQGFDLAGYTIPEVAADIEAARVALGYGSINLLSASYGTRIAQVFSYRFPDRLLRSAMIGVNPPGRFVWEPDTIDVLVRHYASLWAQDSQRVARTPDIAGAIRRVNLKRSRRWGVLPIDPDKVRLLAFPMLFNRPTAAMVLDAYAAADRGDLSGLWAMSVAYRFIMPGMMNWGDLLAKGMSADYNPARDYVAAMDPSDSILGSPLALAIWGGLARGWPSTPIEPEFNTPKVTSVPTLLVSGSVDFSTPAELATKELLPSLTKGQQVVLSEYGHVDDLMESHPKATERLLTSFFLTGVGDDSLFRYFPMDFRVTAGFPLLAKALLAAIPSLIFSLVIIGLALLKRSAIPSPRTRYWPATSRSSTGSSR